MFESERNPYARTAQAGPGGEYVGVRQAATTTESSSSTSPELNRYSTVKDNLSAAGLAQRFLPPTKQGLHTIWRNIYKYDPVAGPAVELYKELPWSDCYLTGLTDKKVEQIYLDSLSATKLIDNLPDMAASFLVLGKLILHLIFSEARGYWTDMIIHDPDWIDMTPVPILGYPPKLDLRPSLELQTFVKSKDPRDIEARKALPAKLVEMITKAQKIPLDPRSTIYLPRKTFASDAEGTSIYTRLIQLLAYEMPVLNASIAGAHRRAGTRLHITAGLDDRWEPETSELERLTELFMATEEDSLGGIVATRTGVEVNEIGSPGNFMKISDDWQFLSDAKMRSLGISDAFMTGDATYNTMESVMSIFLERIRAFRLLFTNFLIIDRFLRPLAKIHGFVRRTQAELDHNIRLSAPQDDEKLMVPGVSWSKHLRPVADSSWIDILEKMEEKGVPVSLKTWASAGGFDLDNEFELLEGDAALREKVKAWKKKTGSEEGSEVGASFRGAKAFRSPEAVARRIDELSIWNKDGRFMEMHKEVAKAAYAALTSGHEIDVDALGAPLAYVFNRVGVSQAGTARFRLSARDGAQIQHYLHQLARDTQDPDAREGLMLEASRLFEPDSEPTRERTVTLPYREEGLPSANLLTGVTGIGPGTHQAYGTATR